jgi:hypothetical protein
VAGPVEKLKFIEAMSCDCCIRGAPLAIGIQLLRHYNNKIGIAWPSYATLAKLVGVTDRTAIASVNKLIGQGWFVCVEGGGRGRSNRYTPVWERVNHSSPFNSERMNSSSVKSEAVCLESVSQSSPEPTYIEPIDEPIEGDLVQWAFNEYNKVAQHIGIPTCQKITTERRKRIKARLKDAGGADGWKVALEKLEGSKFLRGESDRGWKANIDFLLKDANFTKLMEGSYDAGGNSKQGSWAEAAKRYMERHKNDPPPDQEVVQREREQETAARQAAAFAEANRIHERDEMVRKRREGIPSLKEKLDENLKKYAQQAKKKGDVG